MSAPTGPQVMKSVAEMRAHLKDGGTLYVKNHSGKTITANISNQPDGQFLLEAHGRDGDTQIMPAYCLDLAGFQKIIAKGQVTISPDYGDEALAQTLASDAAAEAERDSYSELVEENSSKKDIVQKECLISGQTVFQTQAEIDDMVPPLADEHKDRAHEFVATQVPDAEGNIEVRFDHISIG